MQCMRRVAQEQIQTSHCVIEAPIQYANTGKKDPVTGTARQGVNLRRCDQPFQFQSEPNAWNVVNHVFKDRCVGAARN